MLDLESVTNLDEAAVAKLARELAMNIRPAAEILADYGLSETDYYELDTRSTFFQKAKLAAAAEWNATGSAAERIRALSAAALEQALPHLTRRMMGDEPLPAVTEVAKLFSRNAGLGEPKPQASSERFQITINLGADSAGKPVIETYDKPLAIDLKPEKEASNG